MSETWVINENPSVINNSFIITFTSNDESFVGLQLLDDGFIKEILFRRTADDHFSVWNSFRGWAFQDFRTVIFETAPTGDLLTWLEANAVKQEEPLVIDDLTGWTWGANETLYTPTGSDASYELSYTLNYKSSNQDFTSLNLYGENITSTKSISVEYAGISYKSVFDGEALSEMSIWYDENGNETTYELTPWKEIQITGGTDATNTDLIRWLQDNGTLTQTGYSSTINLTNCRCNKASESGLSGNYSATVSADDGYYLSSVTSTLGTAIISEDKRSATISITNVTEDFTITGVGVALTYSNIELYPNANGTIDYTKVLLPKAMSDSSKQATLIGSGTGQNIKTINNTNILGSGNIDVKELFECTYGTTTYADITSALNSGKTPYFIYSDRQYLYQFTRNDGAYFFGCFEGSSLTFYNGYVTNTNNWSTSSRTAENTSDKVASLSSSSTDAQYPSAKCLYDNLELKQNKLTFDTTPTENSMNPVTSEGIKTYVDNRFDGTSKAISYASYSAMITVFNALADDVYGVGQDIYIVTKDVPDLWVSSVESVSSTYTYVDDATFISDLNTNGYVQVGYYRLSALETKKVDLTDYVTTNTVQTVTGEKNFTTGVQFTTRNDYKWGLTSTAGGAALQLGRIGSADGQYNIYPLGIRPNSNNQILGHLNRFDRINADKICATHDGIPIQVANLMDTTSAQTVTGKKTIDAEMIFTNSGAAGTNNLSIKNDNGYNAKIKMGSTENLRLMSTATYFGTTIGPIVDNTNDLGTSQYTWKDLYLSGNLTDGTNGISIANIESKENKVTSISNASTDTQYPSAKLLYDQLLLKQNKLTFDTTPTENSINPVISGGIKTYVDNGLTDKQDALTTQSISDGTLDKAIGFNNQGQLVKGQKDHTGSFTALTTAPTEDNTDGTYKFVVLDEDPEEKFEGYFYIIKGEVSG